MWEATLDKDCTPKYFNKKENAVKYILDEYTNKITNKDKYVVISAEILFEDITRFMMDGCIPNIGWISECIPED